LGLYMFVFDVLIMDIDASKGTMEHEDDHQDEEAKKKQENREKSNEVAGVEAQRYFQIIQSVFDEVTAQVRVVTAAEGLNGVKCGL